MTTNKSHTQLIEDASEAARDRIRAVLSLAHEYVMTLSDDRHGVLTALRREDPTLVQDTDYMARLGAVSVDLQSDGDLNIDRTETPEACDAAMRDAHALVARLRAVVERDRARTDIAVRQFAECAKVGE